MPNESLEILDTNVVLVFGDPLEESIDVASRFANHTYGQHLRKPFTLTRGVAVNAFGETKAIDRIESMRSQKVVTIEPTRLVVHDVSGILDVSKRDLPETCETIGAVLGLEQIRAFGANFELAFTVDDSTTAALTIANGLFSANRSFLPSSTSFAGGAGRIFLQQDDRLYIVGVEPHLNDRFTRQVWISCNSQQDSAGMPVVEEMREAYRATFQTLREVTESIFPGTF